MHRYLCAIWLLSLYKKIYSDKKTEKKINTIIHEKFSLNLFIYKLIRKIEEIIKYVNNPNNSTRNNRIKDNDNNFVLIKNLSIFWEMKLLIQID
jgi:hypothetical protein